MCFPDCLRVISLLWAYFLVSMFMVVLLSSKPNALPSRTDIIGTRMQTPTRVSTNDVSKHTEIHMHTYITHKHIETHTNTKTPNHTCSHEPKITCIYILHTKAHAYHTKTEKKEVHVCSTVSELDPSDTRKLWLRTGRSETRVGRGKVH